MSSRTAVLVAMLAMAPLRANATDLVVWWEQGFYAQKDEALREIVTVFEQDTGKRVELAFYAQRELGPQIEAALEMGHPPDIAFGTLLNDYIGEMGLRRSALGPHRDHRSLLGPVRSGRAALGHATQREDQAKVHVRSADGAYRQYIHVWKSLLEQAGFTLADIPKEWDAFWSFWCDQVQPAVRNALGREDIWGVGLSMSANSADTTNQSDRFMAAYQADYVTPDGRLVIDNPEIRDPFIQAIDSYTAVYRKGCTPPDSIKWDASGNNKAFQAQAVVMTPNNTLSIVNALKHERPDDYYENTATVEWPLGPGGQIFPDGGEFFAAVVFKGGPNPTTAKEFVRFLVAEGWLAHYLDFAGERMLPPMPKLLEAPFWLDPSDPHKMAAVMQASARPLQYDYATVTGDWRHDLAVREEPWAKAVNRIVTEGIRPEQAVDETIRRIKQILSE